MQNVLVSMRVPRRNKRFEVSDRGAGSIRGDACGASISLEEKASAGRKPDVEAGMARESSNEMKDLVRTWSAEEKLNQTARARSWSLNTMLLLKLTLPLLVGMLLCIGITTVLAVSRGMAWVSPISEVITAEARSTLPDRLLTIHDEVKATLERCTNSLDVLVPAIEDAWNSHQTPSSTPSKMFESSSAPVYYSPCTARNSCPYTSELSVATSNAYTVQGADNPRGTANTNLNMGELWRNGAKWTAGLDFCVHKYFLRTENPATLNKC